jgi:hypothetical protein
MSEQKRVEFEKLIADVTNGEILIPDFQRGFVWNKIENQQRLIASVFSRLPIGSILLLEGNHNEFSCKKIGSKLFHDVDENDRSLKRFLIDGQQRITVLTNAFSDIILGQRKSDVISSKLFHRFYLKIEAQNFDNLDLFGLTNLMFPFQDVKEAYFIGDRVSAIIETEPANSQSIFPPGFEIKSATQVPIYAINCLGDDLDKCIIPLCVINNKRFNIVQDILERISEQREGVLAEIIQKHHELHESEEYNDFINSLVLVDEGCQYINDLKNDINSARIALSNMRKNWVSSVSDYLNLCIQQIGLHEINVSNSERARAIDIYENLNMGGVSLTTFDLLVAKVAREDTSNFQKQIEKLLFEEIKVEHSHHLYSFINEIDHSEIMSEFQILKGETLSKSFIDVFMNLLSISCKLSTDANREINLNDIKRETILALNSSEVIQNFPSVVIGLKRAIIFMIYELGIRKISDVNYEHVFLNIAKILQSDIYWNNPKTFNLLKYWYWTVVFSGSYDKDQSQQMVSDMKFLDRLMNDIHELDSPYLKQKHLNIFSDHYFTKKSILLMEETSNDLYPKGVIKSLILQFILSKKPLDILSNEDGQGVKLSSYNKLELEAHHIIPLNSAASINESTNELRKNKDNILNSPVNFTLITASANRKISGNSLAEYYFKLHDLSIHNHIIPNLPTDYYEKFRDSNNHKFQ